jgi:hypothetical protein
VVDRSGVLLIFAGFEPWRRRRFAALFVTLWVAWGIIFRRRGRADLRVRLRREPHVKVLLGLLYLAVGVYS